jgi:hypothetical protein
LTSSSIRTALALGEFALLREDLSASPSSLARLWPKLTPLERAACWRLLPALRLSAAAKELNADACWEAYQASSIECLAPLLEDAPASARKFFRAPSHREAALLRSGLSR